ncbi:MULTISPECIES: WYL domain-containing protein [Nostoc]|uniref:WYL domain-containing protein n=1 Tax=Nostoc paludosum FACHB-159 TaxID=2692908 RepID=A0ABR8KEW0_9NOSO|nr:MULTISPECIES: WYL domain-containing protein [Nostoc]MBD2679384.1 WYL domain-containing protein [Nostoc sp. FACHB-857]MBD2737259.1 WYL domain-containing protein [Nostoc paludosum FACHB-159]
MNPDVETLQCNVSSFQAIFTKWTLDDFDLLRWIVEFGGDVKVIQPQELVQNVEKIGQTNYES